MATKTTAKPMPKAPARAITNPADFPDYETRDAVNLLARHDVLTGFYFDPAFPVKDMNSTRSRLAQIRDVEYITDHLARITDAIKKDPSISFPAVVLFWDGTAYVNLDGNHRRQGATDAKKPTLPAIVVDLSSQADPAMTAKIIAIDANMEHGQFLGAETAIQRAAALHDIDGLPLSKAATIARVPASSLSAHIQANKVIARAITSGVKDKAIQAIPASVRREFDGIGNTIPFRDAINLAAEHHLSTTEIKALVKDIKALRDDSAQRTYLDTRRAELANQAAVIAANGARAKNPVSTSTRMVRSLSRIVGQFQSPNLAGALASRADRDAAADAIEESIKALRATQRQIRKMNEQDTPAPQATAKAAKAVKATAAATRATAKTATAAKATTKTAKTTTKVSAPSRARASKAA